MYIEGERERERERDKETEEKKHFVLIHGFCHGAWCWYKLVILLNNNGHKVTALDLGGSGIHPKQLQQISSMSDYIHPLMDFMSHLPNDDKVILVGHSYGGIPISLAMENFPQKISLAVFVTASMPKCNDPPAAILQQFLKSNSAESFMDCKFTFDQGVESLLPISAIFGPDYMAAKLYQHCTLEDLELGKMLKRPSKFFMEEMDNKSLLTQERYGAVKRGYVICEDDQVMGEDFQRYNIENYPPDEVVTIGGAGHMVMLSKPQEICDCLQELSRKYS